MPKPTWDRLHPERRDRIIAAGRAEFGAHGFSRASLNTIAREAKVAKGSLFQYFGDKVEFFAHLADLSATIVEDHMAKAIAPLPWDTDFFGSLTEALCQWDIFFAENPEDRALTAAINLEGDDQARMAVRQAVNPHYLAVLIPLIGHGQGSGQIRADADLEMAAAMFLLILPHFAIAPHVPGLDPIFGLDQRDFEARKQVYIKFSEVFRLSFGTV
ncbi:MAG: TetR/AcrR family transcriptional regulator [Actinomycetales bacterium]|nr:TetR/AcrR family transcriptional regulator [Actinomycetales bacterium]